VPPTHVRGPHDFRAHGRRNEAYITRREHTHGPGRLSSSRSEDRGMRLAPGDLGESLMAHRRWPEILTGHAGSIKVLYTPRPLAVVMAGNGEYDPWKD
jgi:hypothetical protein